MNETGRTDSETGNSMSPCLVGWFDILGFKAIMESNTSESQLAEIGNKLTEGLHDAIQIPEKTLHAIHGLPSCSAEVKTLVEYFKADNCFKCYSMSDTIVFIARTDVLSRLSPANRDVLIYGVVCAFFFKACALIAHKMFITGLPVRGAIDYGQCFIKKNDATTDPFVMLGEPFRNAYLISESLEFSGVVVHKRAMEIHEKVKSVHADIKAGSTHSIYRIPTPMKGNPNAVENCLDWISNDLLGPGSPDLRDILTDVFSRFGKHITPEIATKFNNTEMSIRTLMMARNREMATKKEAVERLEKSL